MATSALGVRRHRSRRLTAVLTVAQRDSKQAATIRAFLLTGFYEQALGITGQILQKPAMATLIVALTIRCGQYSTAICSSDGGHENPVPRYRRPRRCRRWRRPLSRRSAPSPETRSIWSPSDGSARRVEMRVVCWPTAESDIGSGAGNSLSAFGNHNELDGSFLP